MVDSKQISFNPAVELSYLKPSEQKDFLEAMDANTKYFDSWAGIKIGGEQLSISLTALTVLVYIAIGAFGGIRWYYTHRRY